MALEVGVNSYATIQEADLYVSEYYLSTDPVRAQWEELLEEDKEVYLRKACKVIEQLPLKGRKLDSSQLLQFPRKLGSYISKGEEIEAQIVQAAYLLDYASVAESKKRMELRKQGVRRITVGNTTETYNSLPADFMSVESRDLIKFWISGGYDIDCGGGDLWILT